jgi:hypothetical protein
MQIKGAPISCGCIVGADLRVRPVSGARGVIRELLVKGEPFGKGKHTQVRPYVSASSAAIGNAGFLPAKTARFIGIHP